MPGVRGANIRWGLHDAQRQALSTCRAARRPRRTTGCSGCAACCWGMRWAARRRPGRTSNPMTISAAWTRRLGPLVAMVEAWNCDVAGHVVAGRTGSLGRTVGGAAGALLSSRRKHGCLYGPAAERTACANGWTCAEAGLDRGAAAGRWSRSTGLARLDRRRLVAFFGKDGDDPPR